MVEILLCLLQDLLQRQGVITQSISKVVKMQQSQMGGAGKLCKAIIQGIQIFSIILRKGKSLGEDRMKRFPALDLSAVDRYFSHVQGSPYIKVKLP